ncbi:MAG: dibenzothiophene desulfurase, partial [Alphaproteobacteria bacterium]
LSLATIWSTAMIYASLKTVARWHHPLTPFVFVGYAISGGLVLAAALDALANGGMSLLAQPALMGLISTAIVTMIWTKQAGAEGSGSTPESATGLGNLGEVRMLMPPHSEENWLQHEMGFVVARKHAAKLRLFSVTLAIILPAVMVYSAAASSALLVLAAITHVIGVMVSRWLFFAEAKHTVMLYYGARH